jgi:hypothetical protein
MAQKIVAAAGPPGAVFAYMTKDLIPFPHLRFRAVVTTGCRLQAFSTE